MLIRSLRTRALQVAGSAALCTVALSAHADPINLQSVCYLTSTIASEGKCQLTYVLGDDFVNPASVRKSQIRVDGILVAQYVNDAANPASPSVQTVSGSTAVACGVNHIVTAQIARVGVGTTYERVGFLPAVLCPVAP